MATTTAPTISKSIIWPRGVQEWLESFAQAVRETDFQAGRELFLEESQSFGTRATTTRNLGELMDLQWRVIWPNTEGFHFMLDDASARFRISSSGDLCTVWLCWTSRPRAHVNGLAGQGLRTGRCTIVLVRDAAGAPWKAVHSHFSREPVEEGWERQLPPAS